MMVGAFLPRITLGHKETDMNSINARKYAAKWFADHNEGEPTDDRLAEAFAHCVRPARPAEYPSIRDAIASYPRLAESGSSSPAMLAGLLLVLVPVSLAAVFVASLAGAVAGVAA